MKKVLVLLSLFSSLAFAIDMTPRMPLTDLCQITNQWFITAHTAETSVMNGNSSCVSPWSEKVVVAMSSFCEEKQNIYSPYYSCRIWENGKVFKDWSSCYNGWSFTATDSCGKYEIEVFARGRVLNKLDNEIESPVVRTSVEFYAD